MVAWLLLECCSLCVVCCPFRCRCSSFVACCVSFGLRSLFVGGWLVKGLLWVVCFCVEICLMSIVCCFVFLVRGAWCSLVVVSRSLFVVCVGCCLGCLWFGLFFMFVVWRCVFFSSLCVVCGCLFLGVRCSALVCVVLCGVWCLMVFALCWLFVS